MTTDARSARERINALYPESHSPHDDPAFIEAWTAMEADGYQYSEGNVEKVHLGWMMARALLATPTPTSTSADRREDIARALWIADGNRSDIWDNRLGWFSKLMADSPRGRPRYYRLADAILALPSATPDHGGACDYPRRGCSCEVVGAIGKDDLTPAQAADNGEQNSKHPSHTTRSSDASSYDEVCVRCGATDIAGGGWGRLALPCDASPIPADSATSSTPDGQETSLEEVVHSSMSKDFEHRYDVASESDEDAYIIVNGKRRYVGRSLPMQTYPLEDRVREEVTKAAGDVARRIVLEFRGRSYSAKEEEITHLISRIFESLIVPERAGTTALREALTEAASTLEQLYHYTFDHGLSGADLKKIVQRDAGEGFTSARQAIATISPETPDVP